MPWPIRFGPLPRMSTAGLVRGRDLGLLVVARVVVRRRGGELGRAGVDGLEDRSHAECMAHAADHVLGACRGGPRAGRRRTHGAWPAAAACASASARRARRGRSRRAAPAGRRTTGRCRSPSDTSAPVAPARIASSTRCSRPRAAACAASSVLGLVAPGRRASRSSAPLRSSDRNAFCSASVKLRPIAIASPTLFMCVVRIGSAAGELLEREPRHLDDHVVERRLEARGRLAR